VLTSPNKKLRRDFVEDFADDPYGNDDAPVTRRRSGVRIKFRGLPTTKWGRIAAGCGLLLCLGVGIAVFLMAKSSLLHDERFVIPSSSSIEFDGNTHVTRAQLLGIFGGDVDRNIFNISLEQRRAELESLPWVAHATVMRLLPNRMRVSIVERTPVAFVRQGSRIGLVDANGVLLDMPTGTKGNERYSFPVVTGISTNDPLSTRAARMKIFERFTADLDGSGEKISEQLSEVDLSNPEDVKALIPDRSTEILVHFGEDNFLDRYHKFKDHLPEWHTLYPKLTSVDMRYDRQVVLEMQLGASTSATPRSATTSAPAADSNTAGTTPPPVAAHDATKPAVKASAASPARPVAKPVAKAPVARKKKSSVKARKPAAATKHHPKVVKPTTKTTPYHPSQAVHP
jgi:cell division protein FtsQ